MLMTLLQEIHSLLRQNVSADKISSQLSPWASALFEFLPHFIRKQVLILISFTIRRYLRMVYQLMSLMSVIILNDYKIFAHSVPINELKSVMLNVTASSTT